MADCAPPVAALAPAHVAAHVPARVPARVLACVVVHVVGRVAVRAVVHAVVRAVVRAVAHSHKSCTQLDVQPVDQPEHQLQGRVEDHSPNRRGGRSRHRSAAVHCLGSSRPTILGVALAAQAAAALGAARHAVAGHGAVPIHAALRAAVALGVTEEACMQDQDRG